MTARKVSYRKKAKVQVGGGNENRAVVVGGRSGGGEKSRGSEPDGHWYIEVAQLQYAVASLEHEDTLYFSSMFYLGVLYRHDDDVWYVRH